MAYRTSRPKPEIVGIASHLRNGLLFALVGSLLLWSNPGNLVFIVAMVSGWIFAGAMGYILYTMLREQPVQTPVSRGARQRG